MASKSNHKIIETWRNTGSGSRYYVTDNDRVLKTTGPKGGQTKVLLQKQVEENPARFIFKAGGFAGGGWVRASARLWKETPTSSFHECERES